jgi:drug/metabolite transporter (DMT)-like permease
MLLFFKALQHLDVTTASSSIYLVPAFGAILAGSAAAAHDPGTTASATPLDDA